MTKKRERENLPPLFFLSRPPLPSHSLGHRLGTENTAWDKQLFIKLEQMKSPILFNSSSPKHLLLYIYPATSHTGSGGRERRRERTCFMQMKCFILD